MENAGSSSRIILVQDGNGYHGLVEEGAIVVNVTPAIRVDKTDPQELLCKIIIINDGERDDNSPFEVRSEFRKSKVNPRKALDSVSDFCKPKSN